jgi:hypothetical protein
MQQDGFEIIIQFLEAEKLKYNDIRVNRLDDIVKKLRRFKNNEIFHPDDLTQNEKEKRDLELIKKCIVTEYNHDEQPCTCFRIKCGNEGIGYFYTDFFSYNNEVDFDNLSRFVESDTCLCGKNCEPYN